ncbi:hypothetical protein D3C76_1453630 [compost metagenome]
MTCTPCFLASAMTPSFSDTKNGLFRVDIDKPIFFCPLLLFGLGFAHSGGSREHPARTMIISILTSVNVHFFIYILSLCCFLAVQQDGNGNDDTFDHHLIEGVHAEQVQTIVQHADNQYTN